MFKIFELYVFDANNDNGNAFFIVAWGQLKVSYREGLCLWREGCVGRRIGRVLRKKWMWRLELGGGKEGGKETERKCNYRGVAKRRGRGRRQGGNVTRLIGKRRRRGMGMVGIWWEELVREEEEGGDRGNVTRGVGRRRGRRKRGMWLEELIGEGEGEREEM